MVVYSSDFAPLRSRLRSEPRASASGISIRRRTSETLYLSITTGSSHEENYDSLFGNTRRCATVYRVGAGAPAARVDAQAGRPRQSGCLRRTVRGGMPSL